ncbi:DegT/DnrJ/EryC1/StrS family aminotransferase [Pelagibacterales bacterium SAG-MED28]|nr:DegT/DnrJ/EryC1/StrS family aminotransferase [Pelagibacterales bacterium SAG-MED28]|tara:strand:- start:273 stop:1484 length:1212 start_codon:yes stop_codon:yes gene_type:complete
MINKRTRLFIQFKIINFFHILKTIFHNKKNFLSYLKTFLNVENLSLTSYGRVALFQIVKIIISESNKKTFFIAPYTIPAVIHAILYAGGKVSYIDIDQETGLIDEEKLEKKINVDTAGVIITHLYSNKKDLTNFINKFDKKLYIIEDAAINFGAQIDNKFLGTIGDFGFFSFAMVKNLNTFTGGAIYIKDTNIFKKYISQKTLKPFPAGKTLNLLITAIFIKLFFNNFSYQFTHYFLRFVYLKNIKFILKKIYPILFHNYEKKIPSYYNQDFNWTMNDVGIYNLKNINKKIDDRIDKANLYKKFLSDEVIIKTKCLNKENALLEFPIILKNLNNKDVHDKMMSEGYDIRHTWYINNIKNDANFRKDNFKNTFSLEEKILCLPLHENISSKDIEKISSLINRMN